MRRIRIPHIALLLLAAAPTGVLAAPAQRAVATTAAEDAVSRAIRDEAGGWMADIYRARAWRPMWASGGRIGPAAAALVGYLETGDADGLKRAGGAADKLREKIMRAQGGGAKQVAEAELALSDALVRFVRDQRKPGRVPMIWADPALKAKRPDKPVVLRAASFARDFDGYVADMGWMSPHYVRLREQMAGALARHDEPQAIARLRRNLERARLLPGPGTRHVVVDASSGRLWYYEAGRQVGTMRVVVGATETQTPMMAGVLQWAIMNPYWNVPTYLARKSVAPKVLAGRSLKSLRMEALTDWSANAQPLPASAIDWHAVASGATEVRLRELPGAGNSMGRVKFLFPNTEGIYLHDTPDRALLQAADRHLSNGCIRLADAPALGKWLLQKPLSRAGKEPEQAVPLPIQVPVYLTYLTVQDDARRLSFRPDVYGRDS